MIWHRYVLFLSLLSVSIPMASLAAPATASESRAPVLEEIIITARRYQESLQNVPISVAVMNDDYLTTQNISQVKDIIDKSPGTGFTRFNKLQNVYSMRGLNSQTTGSAGDPSVLTVVDDVVYVKDYMKSVEFFDVERVEILRGPQGTSFGRNATGGLVHIISKRPTQEREGYVSATAGNYGHWAVNGAVNGPLGDTSAGRLAIHYTTHDGYTRDVIRNRNLAGEENISLRGSLLFTPSDDLEVYLKAEFSRDDDESAVRQPRDCVNPQENFTNFIDPCSPWETAISETTGAGEPFYLKREILNLTAHVAWDVGQSARLTSVSAFLDGEGNYNMDSGGTPRDLNFSLTRNNSSQFSQEIRLDNHNSANPLRWLTGVYYLDDKHDQSEGREWFQEDLSIYGPGPPFSPTSVVAVSTNKTTSLGLFGELSFDLTDRLTTTAGLRYSRDKKNFVINHNGSGFRGPVTNFLANIPANGGPCPPGPLCTLGFDDVATSNSWDHLSFLASLAFAASDDVMLYATVSEAYKTGGYNGEPQTPDDAVIPYNEETALNFELGMKSQWFDRLRLNISAFYVKYDDQQVNVFRQGTGGFITQVIDNAAKSDVLGIEVDYAWQITELFRISGTFAHLEAEFKNTELQTGPGPDNVTDISGNRPNNVPTWTATLVGELELPLRDGAYFSLRADWRGRSAVFNDIVNNVEFRRPGTNIIGARAMWASADERWNVALWGRNLGNKVDVLNIGPRPGFLNDNPAGFGPPRTYGGTVTHRF
ncbi:MAG: TonB-dependent receptor [Gammaproteobacteria bacterium]|nr:TonB-dependent receptor [Gammaproteobacteria bacterium]